MPGAAMAGVAAAALAPPVPPSVDLLVEGGAYSVDRDRVVTGTLTVRPGATIQLARGVTLTLLGDLVAAADRLFTGEGRVDLSRSRVLAARPEWWGARADDEAVDCGPALAACLRAHLATQLGLGTYYMAATLRIDRPDCRIWGVGRTKDARGTRLVLMADTGPVVLVGSEEAPPTINDYLRGVDLRWIELGRARAAPPPAGDDAAAATGLAVRHVLECTFEGLRANEHAIGFSLRGAVRTFLRDCTAFRSLFPSPTRDIFIGFDMDGRTPPIGTGANASLYLIDCVARTGNRPRLRLSVGARLLGAFSDTFLVRLETTDVGTGILIDGRTRGTHQFGHVDLHLDTPVLDQCSEAGIVISDLSDRALIDIRAPYIALAPAGRVAMVIHRCGGLTSVSGGQFIGALAPGATGLSLASAAGVSVDGLKLMGFSRPIDASEASGFDLVVGINTDGGQPGGAPAVRLARCRTGYCRPRIGGSAGVHGIGVELDAKCEGVTIETAGIDRQTVTTRVSVAGKAMEPARGGSTVMVASIGRTAPPV